MIKRTERNRRIVCPVHPFPLPVPGFLAKPITCFAVQAEGDLVVCSQAASKITHFPAARRRFGLKPSIIHTFAGRPPVSSGMDAFVPAAQSLFKRAGVLPESSSLLFFSKKGQKATFNFSNFPPEVLRFFLSFLFCQREMGLAGLRN